MLFAGGAILIEHWFQSRTGDRFRIGITTLLILGGALLAPLALPMLSLEKKEQIVRALAGDVLPPEALTGDMRLQHGWEAYSDTFREVYASVDSEEQPTTVILSDKYNIVSAINFFDSTGGFPKAYSGHMTYYFWGPPPDNTTTVLVCGIEKDVLGKYFESVTEGGTLSHPQGDREFQGMPIYVCKNPHRSLADVWPEFKRFYHVETVRSAQGNAES